MQPIYLHGFASSAHSTKGAFFAEKAAARGVTLLTPDFNLPDFSTLTITRMLDQTSAIIDSVSGPVVLIGSSLGGFVAVQSALRHPDRVERLVLLAPALDFSGNRLRDLGDRGVEAWRSTGTLNVFHYGYRRVMPVGFALYTDAAQYDSLRAKLEIPVLVFQGRRDTAVSPKVVQRWAEARPNVELHMLDDDHQLLPSLETIWERTARVLWEGSAEQA
jgi:pimeloyl-ACP methyl ester carboxylesterase